MRKIPGPPAKTCIGNGFDLVQASTDRIFQIVNDWAKFYYPIYRVRVLGHIAVFILCPEDFELILSNPKHNEKSFLYSMLNDWLGTGLLTSSGQKWASRRKILTPAFHFSILQQFISIFNDQTDRLVANLAQLVGQPFGVINPAVTQYTLKTIAETAMGSKLKFDTLKEMVYKKAICDMGDIYVYRTINTWFVNKYINMLSPFYSQEKKNIAILHNFSREVIAERQKTFKKINYSMHDVYKKRPKLAMLDLLLAAKADKQLIDDEGIREEVDTFMFEGHDTTGAALGFGLMLLACHKDVQERIVEEMISVLGDVKKKPTFNDLQELKYLERVIKEILRLYPSVPVISRKLGSDLVTSSGYKLPKGSTVHLQIYSLHRSSEIYPDPEKFDPDRFLPENSQKRHPFAYLPFSAGPRNCIGQKFAILELKAVICGVLGSFVLEPVDTPESIVLVVDIVLRSKDSIKIKFVKRNQ